MYYLEARIKHDEDVEQIVLYLGKEPVWMRDFIDTRAMRFKFRLIDIGELDGDELAASGDLGDAILSVLAKVKNRREAVRRALDRIATLKGKKRELAVEHLTILAGLRGVEADVVEEARAYMPFVIDLMENAVFRNRYERGVAAGEAKD